MALLIMIIRKMLKNKWLELSLLFGLIVSVGLASCIPIYTEATLQRMLINELKLLQDQTNQYPGAFNISASFTPEGRTSAQVIEEVGRYIETNTLGQIALPVDMLVRERSTNRVSFKPRQESATTHRTGNLIAMSDLQDHIRVVDGRLPANQPVDGVYEVLVLGSTLQKLKLVLNNEFTVQTDTVTAPEQRIVVKPVGVFVMKEEDSLYWRKDLTEYETSMFIDYDLFVEKIAPHPDLGARHMNWYAALDYQQMKLATIQNYLHSYEHLNALLDGMPRTTHKIEVAAMQTLKAHAEKEQKLNMMMWSLNVPVIIMLAFYLFMVSNLITEQQKNEIAVLRSRGASKGQIVLSYVVESVILGAIAFAIGPYLALLISKSLGAANGFMEFVQRASLQAEVTKEAYRYALYAVITAFVMTMIPVVLATRTSIVGHKQKLARKETPSLLHLFFVDVLLIGIALYGLQNFRRRMKELLTQGMNPSEMAIDPLLFIVPTLFMFGLGLLILRLYPMFIRVVYWIGRKRWSPALYAALIQVGRSGKQYQFFMIFLILTIATGLFGASAARTLNQNTEEKIRYQYGADMVMTTRWESNALPLDYEETSVPNSLEAALEEDSRRIQYTEPPFDPIVRLPGIVQTARVFMKEQVEFIVHTRFTGKLMGIDTDEFGKTAWFKDSLLGQHHINDYLNLIASEPYAVLISQSMMEHQKVNIGDQIYIGWKGVEEKPFTVYGVVSYFPGFNPNVQGKDGDVPMLVIAHRSTIQSALALEPYQIWIKLQPDALRQDLYDAISNSDIKVKSVTDTLQQLSEHKKDPFMLGVNGMMTLGFLISIITSFLGFLLYWLLSLKSRILQYGIFRAMGISFKQIIGMLTAEQLLTTGAAIMIGIISGNIGSRIFVPFFQLTFHPAEQVPPFQVRFNIHDSISLYTTVAVMICIGLIVISSMLSRIKIHQAVKLGED